MFNATATVIARVILRVIAGAIDGGGRMRGEMQRIGMGPALAVALIGGLGACEPAYRGVPEGSLVVAGADSAPVFIQAVADSFMAYYPQATVRIEAGGTLSGLEALLNRKAELVLLPREPLPEEQEAARQVGVRIALWPIALDGVAIVVREDNSVYALGFKEIVDVFSGAVADWRELGGAPGWIRLYTTGVEDGTTAYFRQTVLGGGDFPSGAGRALTTRAVVDSVAAHPDAIGYASMVDLDDRVKALPISPPEGGPLKPLSLESVYRKEYPLVRTLFLGTRGIPRKNAIAGFVTFVMSNRGQRIAHEAGLVPATIPVHFKYEG